MRSALGLKTQKSSVSFAYGDKGLGDEEGTGTMGDQKRQKDSFSSATSSSDATAHAKQLMRKFLDGELGATPHTNSGVHMRRKPVRAR